jgi:hypothetical protein
MERKQACATHRSSRKVRYLNSPMNAIGQKKHASIALLTGTTRSFVLTWERLHTKNGDQSPINYESSLKKVSG